MRPTILQVHNFALVHTDIRQVLLLSKQKHPRLAEVSCFDPQLKYCQSVAAGASTFRCTILVEYVLYKSTSAAVVWLAVGVVQLQAYLAGVATRQLVLINCRYILRLKFSAACHYCAAKHYLAVQLAHC